MLAAVPTLGRNGGGQFEILHRGFLIAAEFGELCRPVHLLAALAELDSPAGQVLTPRDGTVVLARPSDPPVVHDGGASYLCSQTQGTVKLLAARFGRDHAPELLLLAIIDQAEPEALRALAGAGIDAAAARRVALKALGQPVDLPVIEIASLCPAGCEGRPLLDEDQLDIPAWEILTRRQRQLPLDAISTRKDWDRLHRLEDQAARRVYKQRQLGVDQELSLIGHHLRRVQSLAHAAHPDLVPALRPELPGGRHIPGRALSGTRDRRLPFFMDFLYNWAGWFGGRWSGVTRRWERIQTRRFAFRTRAAYRDP